MWWRNRRTSVGAVQFARTRPFLDEFRSYGFQPLTFVISMIEL